ncbi:hypothetical protein JCM19294_1983 [Nonlabens tegetincola]|uniref:SGNH hydrolase-type esterase domain-containing protein n=1 Tax=Nonlabens tegetincola TaxID=323273 RepID=A0A090Q0B7_9FLAO|nr:hypothetical protein JCM19294_1983 [Nonlabens tegetincola]
MIKFLKHCFFIALSTLILNILLGKLVDGLLVNIDYSSYSHWNDIVNEKINADILILGSSRGQVGYNTKIIENNLQFKTFNCSYNAGGYNLQRAKYNIYRENNKKPDIVIQNIDLAHFYPTSNLPNKESILPVLENYNIQENLYNKFSLKEIGLLKYASRTRIPLKILRYYCFDSFDYVKNINGYTAISKKFAIDRYNIERFKTHYYQSFNKDMDEGITNTLDFVKELNSKNTIVFLVWLPEHRIRLNTTVDLRNEVIQLINKYVEQNDKVHFIDLSDDAISDDSLYFYDTFHLNEKGATLISNKIANTIKDSLCYLTP